MTEPDLSELEARVEKLLAAYQRLQAANRTLNAEWQVMARKNTELRHRLEAVVARLKALELQTQESEEPQA